MLIIGIIISLITAVLVLYRSSHIYCLWPQGRADSAGVAFIFRKVPHPCSKPFYKLKPTGKLSGKISSIKTTI